VNKWCDKGSRVNCSPEGLQQQQQQQQQRAAAAAAVATGIAEGSLGEENAKGETACERQIRGRKGEGKGEGEGEERRGRARAQTPDTDTLHSQKPSQSDWQTGRQARLVQAFGPRRSNFDVLIYRAKKSLSPFRLDWSASTRGPCTSRTPRLPGSCRIIAITPAVAGRWGAGHGDESLQHLLLNMYPWVN
jgi:hypothetical protein